MSMVEVEVPAGKTQTRAGNGGAKLLIRNVGKRFTIGRGQEVEALQDVSFDVIENEICVLLGPSGCGKSTLLRMIAGLETPSTGRLELDGHAIEGTDRERGMVFQSYTSFDWLTVRRNVEFGMKVNGVTAAERRERAEHWIEVVGLSRFIDAFPTQLSGGMKQRVAIARTLANGPSLLLMDEPFGALDAETRWHMQELLVSIVQRERTTIVMVTHDIQEAIYLADRIVFLSRHPGRVAEEIVPAFKQGVRSADKTEVMAKPGFTELERHIMAQMRAQGSHG